jgi:hypothetical protein
MLKNASVGCPLWNISTRGSIGVLGECEGWLSVRKSTQLCSWVSKTDHIARYVVGYRWERKSARRLAFAVAGQLSCIRLKEQRV